MAHLLRKSAGMTIKIIMSRHSSRMLPNVKHLPASPSLFGAFLVWGKVYKFYISVYKLVHFVLLHCETKGGGVQTFALYILVDFKGQRQPENFLINFSPGFNH